MRDVGQLGEAGEHSLKPTNWRGTTMRRSLTELRLHRGDQLRTVHGRETSGIEAKMARPVGPSQEVPQRRGNKGGPQLASHKRQNVTKRVNGVERLGSQAPRSQKPRRPHLRSRNPGEVAMTTPGENALGKAGKQLTVLDPERELKDSTHMGTSIVSSRNGATGSDRKPPSGPEEQEKPTRKVSSCRSD